MERIERVVRMERLLDAASAAVEGLELALDRYAAAQAGLAELTAYYESGLWREDFAADEAGELPGDLKRGVLSEDAVYDLLAEKDRLFKRLRELGEG